MTVLQTILVSLGSTALFTTLSVILVQTPVKLEKGDLVLVIPSPWGPASPDIIQRAGLGELLPERPPLGSFTQLENDTDFARLKQNGAWLVLDGQRFAELCGQ